MRALSFYSVPLRVQRLLVSAHIALGAVLSLIHWAHYPGLRLLLSHALLFAWLIYAPDMVRLSSLFLIGIAMDSLTNLPFGVSFGSYWLLWWLTLGQRSFLAGQRFLMGWVCFFATAAFVEFLRTGLLAFFSGIKGPWGLLSYDVCVIFLLYPLVAAHVQSMALRLKQMG